MYLPGRGHLEEPTLAVRPRRRHATTIFFSDVELSKGNKQGSSYAAILTGTIGGGRALEGE